MKDPEALYSETFGRFMSNWAYIMSLREFSEIAIPLTEQKLAPIHKAAVEAIAGDSEYSKVIVKLDGSPSTWDEELKSFLSGGMTSTTISNSRTAIDAACLVFAQSMLDDAAMSYCRVCARISPNDWNGAFEAKKVSYSDLLTKAPDAIRDELLDATLLQLGRESLIKKVDKLLLLCKPPEGFEPIGHYKFDRDRLEAIDHKRHLIIHADGLRSPLSDVGTDLEYILKTNNYLAALVNMRYGVQINPLKVFPQASGSDF
jgi:hypothetical protein